MTDRNEIHKKLYLTNEYGFDYPNLNAELSKEDINYLDKEFGMKKGLHKMCTNCQARQLMKYEGFISKVNGQKQEGFQVVCKGVPATLPAGSADAIRRAQTESGLDAETAKKIIQSTVDPVAWVELMFGFKDKDDSGWTVRPGQKELLRCNAQMQTLRWSRRTGKSFGMALKLLYLSQEHMITDGIGADRKPHIRGPRIMIVTPYQSQLLEIFDNLESLVRRSEILKQEIVVGSSTGSLYTRTPIFQMSFRNGCEIKGFVSGVGSRTDSSEGGTLRGQCLAPGTKLHLADGTLKVIEEIKVGDIVLSHYENQIVSAPVTHVFEPSVKQMYKLTLASGRTIEASEEHEFGGCDRPKTTRTRLSNKGTHTLKWKLLGDWRPGEYIAVATQFPETKPEFSDDELFLIGLMTGDGCCTLKSWKNRNLSFATGSLETLLGFKLVANRLGISCSHEVRDDKNYQIRINTKGSVGKLWELLSRAGIAGSYSYEKQLNETVLMGGKVQARILLGALLSTDGWITSNHIHFEVGYISTSLALAKQVQQLMLKLGVAAKLSSRSKHAFGKDHRTQYVVSCKNAHGVRLLLKDTFVLGKSEQVAKALVNIQNRKLSGVKNLYLNDYYLDRIVSVEPTTITKAYDIEVKGPHNFLTEGGIITHNSADVVYLDEMDMISDVILEKVIMPILITHANVMLLTSSTPIGKRGQFYSYCKESPDVKETYFPANVLPHWEQVKRTLKISDKSEAFKSEYMADFIDGGYGVFRPSLVRQARSDYEYSQTSSFAWWKDFAKSHQTTDVVKTIGIDWNKNAGSEFLVMAYDPSTNLRWVVEATNIAHSEFSGNAWKDEVIRLNYKWRPDYIYADEGYGHTIIEDLRLLAHTMRMKPNKTPQETETAKLLDRLVSYNFSSKLELKSPVDGTDIIKTGKEYLVESLVQTLERDQLRYPLSDTTITEQMDNYVVLRRSSITNRPVYGPDNEKLGDHRLDALMLANAALSLEYSVYSQKNMPIVEPTLLTKDALHQRKNPDPSKMSQARKLLNAWADAGAGNIDIVSIHRTPDDKPEKHTLSEPLHTAWKRAQTKDKGNRSMGRERKRYSR